ncbi:MAG TPA: S24/S26 family peptidase [Candidatus Margulisiibacteriota bacterium]|nr:S24/S26 family peptidase [Candidatus Margulisiibacteriota bacterium]
MADYLTQGLEGFSLSGEATVELMQAAFRKGACFRFQVKGYSMSPFIKDNDIITLAPIPFPGSGLGKTVACVLPANNKLLVHRIVGRKNGHYLIKGDNVAKADSLIPKEDILGYVTSIERGNKTIFFSLGLERLVIVFLSKNNLLPLFSSLWRIIPGPLRGFLKCKVIL